jgi:hypothetical protein
MFTGPLLSSARSADNRKHIFSIVALVLFQRNMFAESLPSSEVFQLSGVTSHCFLHKALRSEWPTGVSPLFLFLELRLRYLCFVPPSFHWFGLSTVFTPQLPHDLKKQL